MAHRCIDEQLDALELALAQGARLDVEQEARFAWLYRRHMAAESGSVLLFAREALSAQQLARLGQAMAARRLA